MEADAGDVNAYNVFTADDLFKIAAEVNAGRSFENEVIYLNADIDLTGVSWTPIGNALHPFKGSIRGAGTEKRAISNLQVKSGTYGGLIGYMEVSSSSEISNISLEKLSVSATYAGGMAGYVKCTGNLDVKDCSVSGLVEGKGSTGTGGFFGVSRIVEAGSINLSKCTNAAGVYSFGSGSRSGGLIGSASDSGNSNAALKIEMCGNQGNIIAEATYSYCDTAAGGLVGDVQTSAFRVDQCFNDGPIYAKAYYEYVGGLVGNLNRNRTVSFQIVDSYVNAYIWGVCTNGSSQCGGFIGHITGDNFKHAEISRCYATGNLDARNKAGLICWQQNASRETVIADCRYDREKLNLKDKQFACSLGSFSTDWHTAQLFNSYSLTSAQMTEKENYQTWDFEKVWGMDETRNEGCPYLRWFYGEIPDESGGGFDASVYHASEVYDFSKNTEAVMERFFYEDTPSQIIDSAAEVTNLKNKMLAWKNFRDMLDAIDDPSKIPDQVCEEKDLYEAIILSLFEKATTESGLDDTAEDIANLVTIINQDMKAVFGINVAKDYNFSSLTMEQREKISEIAGSYYDKKGIAKAAKKADIFSKAMDLVNDLQEYCEYVQGCVAIINASESYKLVLSDMYDNCPKENESLRQALEECISVMRISHEQLIEKMLEKLYMVTGKYVAQMVISEIWDRAKKSLSVINPTVALLWAFYNTSTFFFDSLLNTTDIAERTVKIAAVLNIRTLIQKAYEKRKNIFADKRVRETAENYLAAIDVNFIYLDEDCNIAKEYAAAVSDSLVAKIQAAFQKKDSNALAEHIRGMQIIYNGGHEETKTRWLYHLEADYPEEYLKYAYLLDESMERIKKYKVDCPVDVYVYDETGEVAASVVDNKPYCKENSQFTVAALDDTKEIWFYGDSGKYTIQYIGTDNGTMDIAIEEYTDRTELARLVKHIDVPLETGTIYTSQENLQSGNNPYTLQESGNESIHAPRVDTADTSLPRYTLSIANGYMVERGGGGYKGTFYAGEKVTVYANIPDGSAWKGWKSGSGGSFADENAKITTFIMPEKDVQITAEYDGKEEATKPDKDVPSGGTSPSGGAVSSGEGSASTGQKDPTDDSTAVPVEKLLIKAPSKKIAAGKKVSLTVKFVPDNASNSSIIWKSSNEKYAVVDNKGVVTTKKAGAGKSVIITAIAGDGSGVSAKLRIRIMKDAVRKIKLYAPEKIIKAGGSMKLTANVFTTGKDANRKLRWSCSNTRYAVVSQTGKVKARKAGKGKTVTITAMATDGTGKKASIRIRIK